MSFNNYNPKNTSCLLAVHQTLPPQAKGLARKTNNYMNIQYALYRLHYCSACMCVCLYVCMYVYMYVHVCMFVHVHLNETIKLS